MYIRQHYFGCRLCAHFLPACSACPSPRAPNLFLRFQLRRHETDTISATPIESFTKDFAAARLPDYLHADGLRNQPTFFLGGVLALPFIAVAKLRGVCR